MPEKHLLFSARRKDFRIDYFRASGNGGQHRNKTDSAVRITHVATGLSAECSEHREQPRNKREAFRKLAKKLVAYALGEERKARAPSGTDVVRTYHAVDNRVTDHASGKRRSYAAGLRDPSSMIEARRRVVIGSEAGC